MIKFKDKLIALLVEQSEAEFEYINPHLLGEILSALYSAGCLDDMPLQEQAKLDKFVDDMRGA